MGYPMTWTRLVHRNGLSDGGYSATPLIHDIGVNVNPTDDIHPAVAAVRRDRILRYDRAIKMLAGDLRRLENDARDEQAICQRIEARTGIGADMVAAVLLEFFRT